MTQDLARTNAAAAAPEDADYARAHPLTMFGLDALIAGSARLRPERAALADHSEEGRAALAFAELDFAIGAFVARLREFDIEPGARILLCCPPRAQTLIAITAIIAAGFEPVLAPLGLPQSALIAAANASRAEALMAPVRFAKLDFEQALLGVAAQCPSIRLLGALSPEPIDGAVDFSLQGLRARPRTLPAGALISESWTP
ncbi:MAG TPA: AMP-binding protein, partial [Methylocystis sp.]